MATNKKSTSKKINQEEKNDILIEDKSEEVSNKVDEEKEYLKNKLAELQKQVEELLVQNKTLVNTTSTTSSHSKKNIKIISLTRGELYLRGSRIHKFEKQFDSRVFTEGEVRQIYANMPKTLTDGYVYIADSDIVDELELTDAYSNLLNADSLKTLLKKNPSEVVEIYKNVNDVQKNTIIGMIEDQKLLGERLDANILIELGELCNKDLMKIEPLND